MATWHGVAVSGVAGIHGVANGTTAPALKARSEISGWSAIYGRQHQSYGAAVHGDSTGYQGTALHGSALAGGNGAIGTGSGVGIYGLSNTGIGVHASGTTVGLFAEGIGAGTVGLMATRTVSGPLYWAGYFSGAVEVSGALTKAGGGFLIDHPLDPLNKVLEHSFVESPERKNVYDGIGVANESGELRVVLPSYFRAANHEFRYQVAALGGSAPDLHIKNEIADNEFVVGGALPGQRISWQVTAARRDAWAEANPLIVERDKPEGERGLYLNPDAFGMTKDYGVMEKRFPTPQAPQVLPQQGVVM